LPWTLPGFARAGGFELGANGTEALGRGGAFTAKADSPLALEYNVAGFGQQRGTRMLFDSNLIFSTYTFQRAGGDSMGPYALVSDHAQQPFYAPWFGLSTDFGFFRHWTFAIGAFGPSSVGQRDYGVFAATGANRGAASRYDIVSTNLLIVQPTFVVAYQPNPIIDIGLSVQQVSAVMNLASSTYVTQSLPAFPNSSVCSMQAEVQGCDALTRVQVQSFNNFALQAGVLVHPIGGLHIGFNVKSAVNLGFSPITANGTVSAGEPAYLSGLSVALGDAAATSHMNATFTTQLPWELRFGIRYAFTKWGRELADIEFDATYEMWGEINGANSQLTLQDPPMLVNQGNPVTIQIMHNYHDTFSLRLGSALNEPIGSETSLTFRLGALYDSSATNDAYTRLDFDTLAKLGGTMGMGVNVRGLTLNLAYAYLQSLTRTVTDGALLPIDGITGQPLMINGQPAAAVNNGVYSGHNHILSIGLSFLFDEMARGHYWLARRGNNPQNS
jgi:hypothetical protein